MTKPILVTLPATKAYSYPIYVRNNLLATPRKWLPPAYQNYSLVIISDNTVKKLYAQVLFKTLKKQNKRVWLISIPAGELTKNTNMKQYIEEKMLKQRLMRDTLILAVGGGVVGDLAGFIAATYMRGIPYIQIPTTLLAMVDSSVGGKTAINTPLGKNLLGAFWQPKAVIADVNCLQTLPQKQLINGLIEAIKMFLTNDKNSFIYTNKNLEKIMLHDERVLKNIISRAIKIKSKVISADETENHQRMILNFGHTIAHALEQVTQYRMLHGFAVAYGILIEAKISQLLDLLSAEQYAEIRFLFSKIGIFGSDLRLISKQKLLAATKLDKKMRGGKTRYILLRSIGQVYYHNTFAHPVADQVVKQALLQVFKE